MYNELEDKNYLYISKYNEFNFLFVEQRKNIDISILYSFKGLLELLQADIAGIRFLEKSAVDPKYCLLFVDLFTSKIHTYPMKKNLF